MALNEDGFEGGAILTLEQQAQLRVKQHAENQAQPESTVPAKRKRKASADQLAVVETTKESAESE
jgi:hypothetical protein